MTNNDYGIDIVEKLDSLIDFIIEKYEVDIIVPIERKGIRVLELSNHANKLFDDQKILYYSSINFHAKELKNKKIVLFDESVRTGRSLSDKLNVLETFSKRKKLNLHIKTAALLINEKVEHLPNFYFKDMIFDQGLYNDLSNELVYKIISTGKPLDVDHPIANLIIKDEDIPHLLDHLNNISKSRELDHSNEFSDVKLFTIDFQDKFIIPKFNQYPKLFDDGPKKIRLFLKGNQLACIPIVFPCMDISEDALECRKSCEICKLNNGGSICKEIDLKNTLEKNEDKIRNFQSILCYQCVTYELNCRLIGLFLQKLSENIDFKYNGLDEKNLSAIYHKESCEIKKILEKKILNYRMGLENPIFHEKNVDPCDLLEISPMKRDYYINDIRPEYEVSIAITKNSDKNKSLFNHADYNLYNQKIGLSYNQIFDALADLDHEKVSEGIDIALDIGLIKPETPHNGIIINHNDNSFLGVTRIYCTSGENINKSMNFFFNLVAKENSS